VITLILTAVGVGAAFCTVATCYVAVIHLRKLRKQGKPLTFWTACLLIPGVIGWLIDVVMMNWLVATVAYIEWPRELTFSERIQRHYFVDPGRRFTAWWAARLNEIDDTPHIRARAE
jgi:hypothetical protein